ncbi:MAG: head-tail connector protein [Abyssibacter sp.]|uniref:head-tail connector protein n=1 Tax=Abyssibacter sp. TaxID=2320200 RepID=UPI00321B475D
MPFTVITPPPEEPILLAEAKKHVRASHNSDDALLQGLIAAARIHVEQVCERAIVSQTWQLQLDEFPASGCPIELPGGLVTAVTTVEYTDTAGDTQTLAVQKDIASQPARIAPLPGASWPTAQTALAAVRITYQVGWPDRESVPEAIKSAMKLIIGTLYEHREEVVVGATAVELPFAVKHLLWPYRRVVL